MKLFPGHILISNQTEEIYEVIGFKNSETIKIKNKKTGIEEKTLIKDIHKYYSLLKPSGYICFNIVDLRDNLQDVIVSLFREEDMDKTQSIPYAVCRQCIMDFIYQQIDPKSEIVGISISQETCPANVDFGIMLACDNIHTGNMVAVYLDYTLDKILSFVKTKPFDNVLYDNMMEYAKGKSEKYGSYVYNNILSKDIYNGYCKSLHMLLDSNNFMHDFYRAFNIYNFNFDLSGREGQSLNLDELNDIRTMLCKNIMSTIIVKYNYDIDILNLSEDTVLIADKHSNLYVIAFIEDKTKPYEINVCDIGEDNIIKINNIMTKAGKSDSNIRRAYDNIIFNKTKYV